jgi:hypothetical protein
MKLSSLSLSGLVALCPLWASAFAVVVQEKPQGKKATTSEYVPDSPSPEHAMLQKMVGTWDAEVTNTMGATVEKSKGTMVSRALGPMWVVSDFKGEHMGTPFEGHEVCGWDPAKQKYTSSWIDTMKATATTGEGTYDSSARKLTMNMECFTNGKTHSSTNVIQWKDDNSMTMTMQMTGPEAASMPGGMTIEYKRRK